MIISLNEIEAAHLSIEPYIHRTPVMQSSSLNELTGANLYFKCENFQKIGAFKMRGAMNAALRSNALSLTTHSSGNHGQAIAKAASILNVPAYIVMPENSPKIKVNGTLAHGAEIIYCAPNQNARETTVLNVIDKTGATFIHPYDNYDVITGQATAAKELLEFTGPLNVIMAPVGGGGLLSGTALYSKQTYQHIKVIGAEPEMVNDAQRSLHSGKIETNLDTNTIADGLRTTLGEKTLHFIQQYVDDILTVKEENIINAMRLIWERMKIIVEPSCAVPLGVILENKNLFKGLTVGIILTGGNVDLEKLPF
jgi:threonine dehydratase